MDFVNREHDLTPHYSYKILEVYVKDVQKRNKYIINNKRPV